MQKDQLLQNLQGRLNDRNESCFSNAAEAPFHFHLFSSDHGVIRNGGRQGAKWGPKTLLNQFKKMVKSNHQPFFRETEWAIDSFSLEHFDQDQLHLAERLHKEISLNQTNIFLGGGHDFMFPILKAVEKIQTKSKIIVVNFDPHLDTRIDSYVHSGTPFRQWDEQSLLPFDLIQIGTHAFSNSSSTFSDLKKGAHKIYPYPLVRDLSDQFQDPFKALRSFIPFDENACYFFSLDADVLDASTMEAVSAPNYQGLPLSFLEAAICYFGQDLHCQNFGIFEYNPLYENLSLKGARALSLLINRMVDCS